MKEQEWIELAKQKDEEAFAHLYNRYYSRIYHYILKLCQGNHADAQELTQETFLMAYQNLYQLRETSYFPLWLKRIAHSKCTRMFYRNRDALYDPQELKRSALEEKRVSFVPHMWLEDASDKEIVHELIHTLDDKFQEVLYLFYFEQYSIQEIMEQLQLPNGTVKSRIYFARKYLKEKIEAYEKQEGRKITFHLHPVVPGIAAFASWKLSQFKKLGKWGSVQATSVCVCSVALTLATTSTISYMQQKQNIMQEQTVAQKQEQVVFTPVQYQQKTITTPRYAYYVLMQTAPDKETLQNISKEQLQEMQSIVEELQKSDTYYYEILKSSGWIQQFQAQYEGIL